MTHIFGFLYASYILYTGGMRMQILTWQARKSRNMTLKQLEAATGIGKTTLNNIENELVSPTLAELETIAKALDMRITDLFDSDYK